MNKYIVGQDIAKKTLSVGVYQHYRRLYHNIENNVPPAFATTFEINRPRSPIPGALYQEEYGRPGRTDMRFFTELPPVQQQQQQQQRPTSPVGFVLRRMFGSKICDI